MKTITTPVKIVILSITIGFFVLAGYRYAPDLRVEKILHQLELFRIKYNQEKIYLHTDKNTYIAGENIWVKAYIINASDFLPDTVSKDVYVDLLDYSTKQVHTEILRNKKGFAQGYITLNDTLAEGNYQVRAYTNWMRNFDEGYFFSKTISFKNPNYENVITTHRLKTIQQYNKNYKKAVKKHIVTFFPEGGQMVVGLPSVVAFKAEDLAGHALVVSGIVKDKNGATITKFNSVHEGMGLFNLTPVAGMNYSAEVMFENKKTEIFSLPEILPQGTSIMIDPFDRKVIKLNINSNKPISNDDYANEFIIVGQSRGFAPYVSKVQWQGKALSVEIPKNLFPCGIVQITVFDGRSTPLCERLVYIDQPSTLHVLSKVKEIGQTPNDSLAMEFVVIDKDGNPVQGNFSLSVTEKPIEENINASNILNSLLFSTDIKGLIHNPGYYFNRSNPDLEQHRDLLLLTQGWRRFKWSDLLANHLPNIIYSASDGLTVGGIITRDFFGIPINNSKVRMTVLSSYNDEYEMITDRTGRFSFSGLDYEDTISVKIEAFKPSGGKGVQIILTDTVIPTVKTPTYAMLRNIDYAKDKIKHNNRMERLEFKKQYKGKPEPDIAVPKIHSTPNDVIYVGNEASSYSNMFQYLQGRVPGVNVTGDKINIRGINSFFLSTDPLYLIDGVPIESSTVSSLNPLDIAIIEILKGPEAAIYGSRGSNGVIAFYSKRGKFMKRGVIDFGMQGYQKSKEFYVAPYERFGFLPAEFNVPKTLYWKSTVKTDVSGKINLKFKKSVKNNEIQTILEGISKDGELVYFMTNN
jgi:hypothetical protein